MPQILDGNATAAAIKEELKERVEALKAKGITPGLGTVLVGDDPASRSYVGAKHRDCAEIGINSIRVDLPGDITQEELDAEIDKLNNDPACTSYIVQLPLPKHLDTNRVLERIAPEKDADGLHPTNLGKLVLNVSEPLDSPLPCTPNGVIELVKRHGIDWNGKNVVVLGRGITVGRPLGLLLTRREGNATATPAHTGTANLVGLLREKVSGFNIQSGFIATSDSFMSSVDAVSTIREKLPDIVASDMEAAPIAQVARFLKISPLKGGGGGGPGGGEGP